jgi:hypothetical protein
VSFDPIANAIAKAASSGRLKSIGEDIELTYLFVSFKTGCELYCQYKIPKEFHDNVRFIFVMAVWGYGFELRGSFSLREFLVGNLALIHVENAEVPQF